MKEKHTYEDEVLPLCEGFEAHEELTAKVKALLPDDQSLDELADLYKLFGDKTRIKILCVLLESELCVCDIATLVGMSVSAVSHQLKALKQAKLIKYRKSGKTIFYSLADDHVSLILHNGIDHINE